MARLRHEASSGELDKVEPAGRGQQATGNTEPDQSNKQKLQQLHQLQRDLADAISRLASLDDIRILLACGAKVDAPVTQGLYPIHYAAYQNFVAAVRLLLLRGCDINAMDDNGYTPVHLCAERGYRELLELLVKQGARVRFTELRRLSAGRQPVADEPLSLALKRGHLDCAELLLKNGADPNARYFMGSEINLVSELKVSSIRLLLEHGARPDSRDRAGLTPLMKAARHPQGYTTVKLLINHGADVNDIAGERHDFRTVLHHSIFSGNIQIIRLLLASGARYPRLDLDKPTPLDIAIISERLDIVKLLVEFEADVNAGTNSTIGQPLHTALTQRVEHKRPMVRLLLDHGADPNSTRTSNRNTGPPLHDYLNSIRQCSPSIRPQHSQHQPQQQQQQQQLSPSSDRSPHLARRRLEALALQQHLNEQQRHYHHQPQLEQQQQQIYHNNNHQRLFASGDADGDDADAVATPEFDMVRMLIMYGARVILKTGIQHPLGLVRTLERLKDQISLDLLQLLIDAAEEIDWFMMSKVIYGCLRHSSRCQTNELFDPSVAAEMTPQRLASILADESAHHYGLDESLIKLINASSGSSSSILSLRQVCRIKIRRHLTDHLGLSGRQLITRLCLLDLPPVLIRYLLYRNL